MIEQNDSSAQGATAQCTLCSSEPATGFYTGCMVKDGHAPEWDCDGKGNLVRRTPAAVEPAQDMGWHLQARPAAGGDWISIFPSQLEWMAKEGLTVRAVERSANQECGKQDEKIHAVGSLTTPFEILCEIANRAGNFAAADAAEWMPGIYAIASEAVGADPAHALKATGFDRPIAEWPTRLAIRTPAGCVSPEELAAVIGEAKGAGIPASVAILQKFDVRQK